MSSAIDLSRGQQQGRGSAVRQWEGRGLLLAPRPQPACAACQPRLWGAEGAISARRCCTALLTHPAAGGWRAASAWGSSLPPNPPRSPSQLAGSTVQCRDATPENCTEERFASTQCSTVVDPATGEPVRHCVKLYRRYLKCAGRCERGRRQRAACARDSAGCFAFTVAPVASLWPVQLRQLRCVQCQVPAPQCRMRRNLRPNRLPSALGCCGAAAAASGIHKLPRLAAAPAGPRRWMRRSRRSRRGARGRSSWRRT